jgi:hypothetical protein
MENGNGTKALWAVILAGGTLIGNGGVFVVNRLVQMEAEQAQVRVTLEQRITRIEAKLDQVLLVLRVSRGRR